MTNRKRWLLLIPLLLVLLAGGFVVWGSTPLGPAPAAEAAIRAAEVTEEGWFVFAPNDDADVGLILYPGGRVDPRSYAPAAQAIAEKGYQVVIPPMPLNLAVLGADRADAIIAASPDITTWAIGGHSLGGAMAARYADEHPDAAAGLVLWASYPAEGNDLSARTDLAVVSIYGTRDGLATEEEIAASEARLPPETVWAPIPGGNHAQFGAYGPQARDNEATISWEKQQAILVEATIALLASLEE